MGIKAGRNDVITEFVGGEYKNVYIFAVNGGSFGKLLLKGLFTLISNLIIISLCGMVRWLFPINIIIFNIKVFSLTQTFISFKMILDSVNLICISVILIPLELVMLFIFAVAILISYENCQSLKENKGTWFKNFILKECLVFLFMFVFYVLSLFAVRISVNVLYVNFI